MKSAYQKSAYQLDQEMMNAWFRWMKAQEIADRARADYIRAARALKRHMEEHEAKEANVQKGDE